MADFVISLLAVARAKPLQHGRFHDNVLVVASAFMVSVTRIFGLGSQPTI
jgi:hypothetical protein